MVNSARSAADLLHEARSRERNACVPEAIQGYEAAISSAERSGEKAIVAEALRARIEQNLGVLDNIKGDIGSDVTHYERSVEAYVATNDEHGCATAYVNLGIAHTDLKQYDKADDYFTRSFAIAERAGDAHLQGMCLVNHAEAHFLRERYEEARRNAEAALAIFDQLG